MTTMLADFDTTGTVNLLGYSHSTPSLEQEVKQKLGCRQHQGRRSTSPSHASQAGFRRQKARTSQASRRGQQGRGQQGAADRPCRHS